MLNQGVTHKCQQKIKEKQTACASRDFWKGTGMKLMRKGVKDTQNAKKAAGARAAEEN